MEERRNITVSVLGFPMLDAVGSISLTPWGQVMVLATANLRVQDPPSRVSHSGLI